MRFRVDSFVVAIAVAVALAYLKPSWGAEGSPIPLDLVGSIGVALIFFFYGLKLSPDKVRDGLSSWKLHALVQVSTFLVFPLVVMLFLPIAQAAQGHSLWLSFLFLAALPSTVSSSVVMVSMAKGNIPAAIFNASISGLIGIAVTPLWVGPFVQHTVADYSLSSIYSKLAVGILLPVLLGLGLQRKLGQYAQRWSKPLATFDKLVILLIIYRSFAESFEKGVFASVDGLSLLLIAVAALGLFVAMYLVTGCLARLLKLCKADSITVQFCGTKKSLVHGTVFSKILFPSSMPMGVVLLPLMMFHALQILIVSIIAARLGRADG